MRIFIPALLMVVISCQSEKERIYEGVKNGIEKYIYANMGEESIHIDSVSVISVDTLTSEKINIIKQNLKINEISKQKELLKINEDILSLSLEMGFDGTVLKTHQDNVKTENDKLIKLNDELLDIQKMYRATNDIVFEYYLASTIIYYTENGAFHHFELTIPMTEDFKVVETTDL